MLMFWMYRTQSLVRSSASASYPVVTPGRIPMKQGAKQPSCVVMLGGLAAGCIRMIAMEAAKKMDRAAANLSSVGITDAALAQRQVVQPRTRIMWERIRHLHLSAFPPRQRSPVKRQVALPQTRQRRGTTDGSICLQSQRIVVHRMHQRPRTRPFRMGEKGEIGLTKRQIYFTERDRALDAHAVVHIVLRRMRPQKTGTACIDETRLPPAPRPFAV